jgi:hypothetical protein
MLCISPSNSRSAQKKFSFGFLGFIGRRFARSGGFLFT